MANTFTTTFVNVPIEKLFEELVLGATSFDQNVAQILPGFQTNVALNRFQASGAIELRNPVFGAGTLGDLDKNEKSIAMVEMQLEFKFDPYLFNLDHRFLWNTGEMNMQEPSSVLRDAVMSTVSKEFNFKLETLLWQGGLTGLTGWEADIAAADVAGNVTTITAQGVITEANVIGIFEDIIAGTPANVRELGNPTMVMPHAVKYSYLAAQRALDFKGVNVTEEGLPTFAGIPIISTHGITADQVYLFNAGAGDESELKAAVWADSDRFNVKLARTNELDDEFGVKIYFAGGTNTVYNSQIVQYLPA